MLLKTILNDCCKFKSFVYEKVCFSYSSYTPTLRVFCKWLAYITDKL